MAPPTPEQWSRLRALFHEAEALDQSARAAWLERACDDPSLRSELQRLLDLADQAGTFLEQPAFRIVAPQGGAPQALAAGDRIADRFVVVRLLGRGGMGEVYEADDEVLAERVAMKVVRADARQIEQMAVRLRREVQLGRKVSHPGVCRLHDVVLHTSAAGGSVLALTMELLNGETLAQRLQRGPLPIAEALDVARQLASALDAAHTLGVLHRDIKPGNVFLESGDGARCRAVITDFGLARSVDDEASEQSKATGVVLGTPQYMAPEQLAGGASRQSDRYALALVVREMLTGPKDLESGTVARPLPARSLPVMARALSERPDDRFGSAREMVEAIARAATPRRRMWLAASLLLAASLAVAAAVAPPFWLSRLWNRTTPVVTPASQILLGEVLNGTQDPDFDGVAELIRSQLAQSPRFELVPPDQVTAVLTQMQRAPATRLEADVAREVAMRAVAPLVVFVTLTRLGQEYLLNVRIERVGSRPASVAGTWTESFSAQGKREVPEAIHDAAVWVRGLVGETQAEIVEQDRPASDTTTSSWEALRLFTQANASQAAGKLDDSVLLLEQAIRVDPTFAMGHMRLADVLMSLKREREGYEMWRRAIDLAERQRVTSRESLRIRGQYFADTGAILNAERAFRTYALHYPNDYTAAFHLASALASLGRVPEAATWFNTAAALRPSSFVPLVHLTRSHLDLGQSDLAKARIAELRRLQQPDWAVWLEGLSRFSTGDITAALATIAPLASADVHWRSRAFAIRAAWLCEWGDDARALDEVEAGLTFDQANGLVDREADKWLYRAELHRRLGQAPDALSSVERALALASSAPRVTLAGGILARVDALRRAQSLLAFFAGQPSLPRIASARRRLEGEIALASGSAGKAVASLDAAFAEAPRYESRLALARALVLTGELARARVVLEDVVQHPVRLYAGPQPELPGMWADALEEYARLLEKIDPEAAEEAWKTYRRVRLQSQSFTSGSTRR